MTENKKTNDPQEIEPSQPLRGKLSGREAGLLLEQLSAGLAQQLPLEEIFTALADDLTNRRLSRVAKQLAEKMQLGADLESAVNSLSAVLPVHMRRAIAIGAKSGNLAGILAGLAESELARRRMQRGLYAALAYPMLVISFLLLVLFGMSISLVPEIAKFHEDFGMDLSVVTNFTLKVAEYFPLLLLVVIFFLLNVLFVSYYFADNRWLHWLRTSLPLLGRAWIWSGQHEFATLMATLTEQHVPTTEALACTAESLRDRNLAWAASRVAKKCKAGATLSQSLQESIHFDQTLTSLTEWGEQHQTLPAALREAANTYEQQMQIYNQFLYRIMPPLMLTLVVTALLLLMSAMFLPLVEITFIA